VRQWRVDTSWYCPGHGCRAGEDRPHARHFVARVRLFGTEDRAARWYLRASQEGALFSAQPNAEDLDIVAPYPVGSDTTERSGPGVSA